MSIASFLEKRVDLWLPAAIGIAGLSYLLHIADHPTVNSFQIKLYVVVLALSSAAFAALIPGMLSVALDTWGLRIRAIGAIGVFVVILFFPPAQGWLAAGLSPEDGGRAVTVAQPASTAASTPPATASAPAPVMQERVVTVAKREWLVAGGDGQGGTLLYYDIEVPGRILSVSTVRCTGCGGWFWLCPDPRCSGRNLVETVGPNRVRLWAATNNSDATSTTFSVKFES